jgi:uncharacterized small protein (DUF1192 family)
MSIRDWFTSSQTTKNQEAIMAGLTELNAAIAALQAQVTQLGTDLAASIADLQAKIAAGTDTSAAIANLQAIATQLTAISAADKGL